MTKSNQTSQVSPGEMLGIIGGGQLGRMIAIAAKNMGIRTIIFSEQDECPARAIADEFICGSYQDANLLDEFSRKAKVITYEFENIPLSIVDYLETRTSLYPGRNILSVTQDRLSEKTFCSAIGIPTADFHAIAYEGDIKAILEETGKAGILKTRRMGYDGKGQITVNTPRDAVSSYYEIKEAPAILEEKVSFSKEFSVVAVRTISGEFYHYDIAENIHEEGILRTSTVPSSLTSTQEKKAIEYTQKIADSLGYVGVLAVEYFIDEKGNILANEIAPRVHNSGHWTIDGCVFDQFEQHVRAICGWTLGHFKRHSNAVMTNLLGNDIEKWQDIIADGNTVLHLYGKSEVRAGRKMGHATTLSDK